MTRSFVESLEFRRLLSISATFENGVVAIVGSAAADAASVRLLPVASAGGMLGVYDANTLILTAPVPAVSLITAELLGGHDAFECAPAIRIPSKIDGGDGNDILRAGGGANTLVGGAGNDQLFGGDGRDDFSGGTGYDPVSYAGVAYPLRITLDNIANDGGIGSTPTATEGDNVRTDIERVIGGNADDFISAALGNLLPSTNVNLPAVQLEGGPGNDTLIGRSIRRPTLAASSLDGEELAVDSVKSTGDLAANTALSPTAANAFVNVLLGQEGDDRLTGGDGNDLLNGGAGDDLLDARGGNDQLQGDLGRDTLLGGDGNDLLDGGSSGANTTSTVNAISIGGDAPDDISGGPGIDTVTYAARTVNTFVSLDDLPNDGATSLGMLPVLEGDNVRSDVENVIGGRGNDVLTGSAADNALSGGDGNDALSGLAGNDTLEGGRGNDQLLGGEGDDLLLARDGSVDTVNGGPGNDRAVVDLIDLVSEVEIILTSPSGTNI